MEILDILMLNSDASPSFVVDTSKAGDGVPIVHAAAGVLCNSNLKETFLGIDNFIILSCGYVLPENFVMAKSIASSLAVALVLYAKGTITETIYLLTQFGGSGGSLLLPLESYEMPINNFINMKDNFGVGAPEPFVLYAALTQGQKISMTGIPSALNTTTQKIKVFLKILHNIPLVGGLPPA
jgi:hypothetical protein